MTRLKMNPWLIALAAVLIVRLASLGFYPLTDTTEARYGEVSRVMATSGNWITPQLEVGVPFWAKPPLSFWQSAVSMSLLGISEFSARLPALLNMLIVMALLYCLAREVRGTQIATVSVFIVVTTVVGFITAGAVMTDAAMLLATTLAMVSFWWALARGDKRWGYVFFIALALGLLAKGPIAWVLTGIPLLVWLTLERRWCDVFRVIPVIGGTVVLSLMALPWYVLAELETPGFLHYFFIGEHIQRFIDSGWEGDRYGTAHDEPRGMIWLFGLAAFAPWSVVALIMLMSRTIRLGFRGLITQLTSLQLYLLLWCLAPLVFFSFAGNILPTYVLSGLPAFALLLAMGLGKSGFNAFLIGIALLLPVMMSMAGPLGLLERLEKRSQAELIEAVRNVHPELPLIYFGGRPPHSARFYSQGTALFSGQQDELVSLLSNLNNALLVVPHGQLPLKLRSTKTVEIIGRWEKHSTYLYTSPALQTN